MAPRRHTTDAIRRSVVRQEVADTGGCNVEWSWDFQKAFDRVDRAISWPKARDAEYPMSAMASSIVPYGWGRMFALSREVLLESRPCMGIAAGSPFAPYELAVCFDGAHCYCRALERGAMSPEDRLKAVLSVKCG